MKEEYVNYFIISVCKVMKEMCKLDFNAGESILKKDEYLLDSSLVKINFFSDFTDKLILNINHNTALEIVSKLVATPGNIIDEFGISAISELGNIIAGNAATILTSNSNSVIHITPPLYCTGQVYQNDNVELLSIPFSSKIGDLSVDIFV